MNTNNKKEWEKVVSRAHIDMNGHCPLAEDEAIIEADKKIKQLEEAMQLIATLCKDFPDVMVTAPEAEHLVEMRSIKKIANKCVSKE